jgi:molecular chaperone DnaK (HSP70)
MTKLLSIGVEQKKEEGRPLYVGIDLGTTNSLVAVSKNQKAWTIKLRALS